MGGDSQFKQRLFAKRKERIVIAFEHRLEGLTIAHRRVFGRQVLHAVKGEKELCLKRLLAPERAVVIERGDALGGGTNSGPPCFVTRATKSRIADFAAPSFQEGSGKLSTMDGLQRQTAALDYGQQAN